MLKTNQNHCQKCQTNIGSWPDYKLCPECWLKNGKSHELKIMKNKKIKQIQHDCQYQLPNCQKIAVAQRILKLGSVTIDKGWICNNCQGNIEKERKHSPTAVFERMSKKKKK